MPSAETQSSDCRVTSVSTTKGVLGEEPQCSTHLQEAQTAGCLACQTFSCAPATAVSPGSPPRVLGHTFITVQLDMFCFFICKIGISRPMLLSLWEGSSSCPRHLRIVSCRSSAWFRLKPLIWTSTETFQPAFLQISPSAAVTAVSLKQASSLVTMTSASG